MIERDIVLALQRGIPLAARPFAVLGEQLGFSEADVFDTAAKMFADGSARRFGAVFDARRLGYRSVLCAISAGPEHIERLGAIIAQRPGVTHCYERGTPPELSDTPGMPAAGELPDLWFTLAALHDDFEADVEALSKEVAPAEIVRLPAVRRFKIDVVFDPAEREKGERAPGMPTANTEPARKQEVWTNETRAIVRGLQGNVPLRTDFYAAAADSLGMDRDALLGVLNRWKQNGVLRRVALIPRHRKMGFKANAMCVWPVADADVLEKGREVAAWPAVTHCYQRPPAEGWPYTLFAMIHTGSWPATHALFKRISDSTGLAGGCILGSLREFKKTSMDYFAEE